MNNNELENIETIALGGNVEPTTEPVVTNVEVSAESVEPVINATEVPVQNVPVTPEAPVAMETEEPVVNPQTATLNQIQTDAINAESSNEAQIPSTTEEPKNPESLGTVTTENGEIVEVAPTEVKSLKDTLIPLVILSVGLLAFILLIPKISELLGGF